MDNTAQNFDSKELTKLREKLNSTTLPAELAEKA